MTAILHTQRLLTLAPYIATITHRVTSKNNTQTILVRLHITRPILASRQLIHISTETLPRHTTLPHPHPCFRPATTRLLRALSPVKPLRYLGRLPLQTTVCLTSAETTATSTTHVVMDLVERVATILPLLSITSTCGTLPSPQAMGCRMGS